MLEQFFAANNLKFQKVEEADSSRPDYSVKIDDIELIFEIKELEKDENFKADQFSVSSRTIGEHIRKKITDTRKRKQMRYAVEQELPSILLIYNNIDPWHLFGTEYHDFIHAMYGKNTVCLDNKGQITNSFFGRNKSFTEKKNTSFSAVGRLSSCSGKMNVTLFENIFSKIKIQYDRLPACFDVVRFSP